MATKELTRTEAVMEAIKLKIAGRVLAPGDRLPSVRRFAETLKVSPSTVVEAYDRLVADGVITARRGSGFYVTGSAVAPLPLADLGPRTNRAVDPFWVSKQSLDADPSVLTPGCGWLPTSWMPNAALRSALRVLARADETVLANYGSTRGSLAVRRYLLGRFAEEGLGTNPDQLILTGSGTQAIDLICRLLVRPDDIVLVDDPCYFNFRALLRAHQVKTIGVPYTATGPDVEAFEAALALHKPRLYITNSALHNPTGASLSPQTAFRVLSAAAQYDLTIVEDDIFGDFEPAPSPRLAVLDGLNRVIRIGSFSKTLSASVRCGYIAGRSDWIEGLVDLQVATNFGGPSPTNTELIATVLASGSYRKHIEEVRQRLGRAQKRAIDLLTPLGLVPWIVPRGGFFLWCRLSGGYDSTSIAQHAMESNVVLAPGNIFSVSRSAASFFRFNVAQLDDERIFVAIREAMRAEERRGCSSG
jgi:DNA-binding transcriptional MocR family regulator